MGAVSAFAEFVEILQIHTEQDSRSDFPGTSSQHNCPVPLCVDDPNFQGGGSERKLVGINNFNF